VCTGLIPIDDGFRQRQAGSKRTTLLTWRAITMPAIIALAFLIFLAFIVVAVVGFTAHLLFSPWLWVVAIGVVAWIKFRPGRSRR
jgi:hypothetical protein